MKFCEKSMSLKILIVSWNILYKFTVILSWWATRQNSCQEVYQFVVHIIELLTFTLLFCQLACSVKVDTKFYEYAMLSNFQIVNESKRGFEMVGIFSHGNFFTNSLNKLTCRFILKAFVIRKSLLTPFDTVWKSNC
jgi:hypothetical protein